MTTAAPGCKRDNVRVERRAYRVRGIVQGVGFRPFVYGIARRYALSGFVLNDGEGVVIEVEGAAAALADFERALAAEAPPLARIDSTGMRSIEPRGMRASQSRPAGCAAAAR